MRPILVLAAFLFLFDGFSAPAQQEHNCPSAETIQTWNRFAQDANTYVTKMNLGVWDVKLRARLQKEWAAVTRSDCW